MSISSIFITEYRAGEKSLPCFNDSLAFLECIRTPIVYNFHTSVKEEKCRKLFRNYINCIDNYVNKK